MVESYDILKSATSRHYAEKTREGYQWLTNTRGNDIQERTQKLSAQGLEFFVGNVAFGVDGKIAKGMRVILVKGDLVQASRAISPSQE
jgi:hypothetical protein